MARNDYGAEYRVLDLTPGASLQEILDRGRLLYNAFEPDGMPSALRARATERARQITEATEELAHYWQIHGEAPPATSAAAAERPPASRREPRPAALLSGGTTNSLARELPVPTRRPMAAVRSVLLKAAIVALVIAAALRVQQYRAAHPTLTPFSEPNEAVALGMPAAPPAQWSGMSAAARQMVGAAAPAVSGRQRQTERLTQ